MKAFVCLAALAATAGSALAQVDGSLDGSYGGALAVQGNGTQFGDSNLGQFGSANGSELNAAFGYMTNSNLHVIMTGNLESNFNKLEIFIDTGVAGQNQLRGDNPNVDFNGLNRMAGLTFDSDFQGSRWISFTGDGGAWYANGAILLPGGGGQGEYMGTQGPGAGTLSGGNNFAGLNIAIDNSNTGGVTSGDASGALNATTGIEFTLPLSWLGLVAGDTVKVSAFINGGGHDFVSNQVLGSLPGGFGNLGEPSNVRFNDYSGNQYFTVIPSTGSLALVGLAGLAGLRRRR